jgi:hypothetical protein
LAAGKEQFAQQMAQIVNGVVGNKNKVLFDLRGGLLSWSLKFARPLHFGIQASERLAKEQAERDRLRAAYLELVEQARQYHKTVQEYETECGKNEQLLARLKKRGSRAEA